MSPAQKPRRLVATVLAAVVVAAAAGLVAGSRGGEALPPEDVVGAYLAAVRRGDVEQALRIAGDPDLEVFNEDPSLLTAEVLSGDWTVQQVIRRYPWYSGRDAVVDVTLSAPDDLSAQGRFRLTRDLDRGGWVIDHPFATVHATSGVLDHLEINGQVRPVSAETSAYLLFPGVYRGWTRLAGLFAGGTPAIVAVPGSGAGELLPPSELSPAGRTAAQEAVNAYLDGCAESTDIRPLECPFAGGNYGVVSLDDGEYGDLDDLAWEILTYPEVLPVSGWREFGVVPRHDGTVRLTGTGSPLSGDEADREAFSAECSIDVTTLHLTITHSGQFKVAGGETFRTC